MIPAPRSQSFLDTREPDYWRARDDDADTRTARAVNCRATDTPERNIRLTAGGGVEVMLGC